MNRQNSNKLKWITGIIAGLVILFVVSAVIYVNDYYKANGTAIAATESNEFVEVSKLDKTTLVFTPKNKDAKTGFIFYPGGKVQYEAYAPLMQSLAEEGILSVLVKMPANLAVLNVNAADGIKENFKGIKEWYIGGHSLGGAMAASYVKKHPNEYKGLILLGAYSTVDISDTSLRVLCIYGSNDGVMRRNKYQKGQLDLPADWKENVIEGGVHAYFGSYGEQSGDGEATITPEEQWSLTTKAILQGIA